MEANRIPADVRRSSLKHLPNPGVLGDRLSQVFLMDCEDGMRHYPDKFFDIAVVDPQYGISAPTMQMGQNLSRRENGRVRKAEGTAAKLKKGRLNQGAGKLKDRILNRSTINWDFAPPSKQYFDELFRVSKNQVIFGGNYFDLPPTRCIICWDKRQPWRNFSQWEMAWTSFDRPAIMYRISNTGGANSEVKIHPTQKPVALYENIYRDFCTEGMSVLDTHLGSGSSRIAAAKAGLNFTAFEIDEEHFDAQEKRWLEWSKQTMLF